MGVDPRDVVAVAVSHLHNDHVGGLRHFAGRAPVHLQRAELEAALADPLRAERNAMFRIDFDDPRIEWRLAEGDVEIAPGVIALLTAGHTPGHQSFLVELDQSAGGGGYGPPAERDLAAIQADLDDGYISPTAARDDYGLVVEHDSNRAEGAWVVTGRQPGIAQ